MINDLELDKLLETGWTLINYWKTGWILINYWKSGYNLRTIRYLCREVSDRNTEPLRVVFTAADERLQCEAVSRAQSTDLL